MRCGTEPWLNTKKIYIFSTGQRYSFSVITSALFVIPLQTQFGGGIYCIGGHLWLFDGLCQNVCGTNY